VAFAAYNGGKSFAFADDTGGHDDADVDYLIVGGGGGGIQTALFLQKYGYSYTILEKEASPGSFWSKFPRFRELISVNKWTPKEKHRLRYDWHSMLEAPLQMMDITESYFPSGDEWQTYMSEVVRLGNVNIEYGSHVERIESNDEGRPCVVMSDDSKRCARRRLFVATGLREKEEPLLRAMGAIPYSQVTKSAARRKRVCIFGNGNSGFEIAQNLFDVAAKVSIYGRSAVRLSAVTKYVGDVRTKFLQVLENFHFKLLDTVDQADGVDIGIQNDVRYLLDTMQGESDKQLAIRTMDAARIMNRDRCELSVIATGFKSHVPGMNMTSRFPSTDKWYESKEVPYVHYVGWLMHEQDFQRNSGGFFAGYRYLIQQLMNHVREVDDGVGYPRLRLTKEEVIKHTAHRLDTASDLIILQDGAVLRDAIAPTDDTEIFDYYEGATYKYLDEIETANSNIIYLYFMWGDTDHSKDVFENLNRYSDTKTLRNNHLHPVIEVNGLIQEIGEHSDLDWNVPNYFRFVNSIVRSALEGNTTSFIPKPKPRRYIRDTANVEDKTRYESVQGKGEGPTKIPSRFASAVVDAINRNFTKADLDSIKRETLHWMPFSSTVKMNVVENFLSPEEIQPFLDVEVDRSCPITSHGITLMPNSILSRLPRDPSAVACEAEQLIDSNDDEEGPMAAIMTKMIVSTTPLHYDRHKSTGGILGCEPNTAINSTIDGPVGFIFLNTNHNATFVHQRDGRIPVVAGNLVTFDGNLPHHTVVTDGAVHLVGPFHLQTMQYIGGYN
jgi:thioredoxin reductase